MTDLTKALLEKLEKLRLNRDNLIVEPENSIIRSLLGDREALRAALKNECCCPGETSWITGKEILCDSCDFLAASDARFKEIVGEG